MVRARSRLAMATVAALSLVTGCHHAHHTAHTTHTADAGPKDPSFTRAMQEICDALSHADALPTAGPMTRLGQASRWLKGHIRHVEAIDFLNSLRGLPPDERATALREKARSAGIKHCALADYMDRIMAAKPSRADAILLLAELRSVLADPVRDRPSELVAACTKIPSCSRDCLFSMAGVANGPRNKWQDSMSHCEEFAEFASDAGHEPWIKKLGTWIRKRLAGVAEKLAPKMHLEELGELQDLCRRLQIPLKK